MENTGKEKGTGFEGIRQVCLANKRIKDKRIRKSGTQELRKGEKNLTDGSRSTPDVFRERIYFGISVFFLSS